MNKFDFSKLLSLSDEELVEKISQVASAAGASSRSLNRTLADTDKLRNTIGSLTEQDVKILLRNVSPEKIEEIKSLINNEY